MRAPAFAVMAMFVAVPLSIARPAFADDTDRQLVARADRILAGNIDLSASMTPEERESVLDPIGRCSGSGDTAREAQYRCVDQHMSSYVDRMQKNNYYAVTSLSPPFERYIRGKCRRYRYHNFAAACRLRETIVLKESIDHYTRAPERGPDPIGEVLQLACGTTRNSACIQTAKNAMRADLTDARDLFSGAAAMALYVSAQFIRCTYCQATDIELGRMPKSRSAIAKWNAANAEYSGNLIPLIARQEERRIAAETDPRTRAAEATVSQRSRDSCRRRFDPSTYTATHPDCKHGAEVCYRICLEYTAKRNREREATRVAARNSSAGNGTEAGSGTGRSGTGPGAGGAIGTGAGGGGGEDNQSTARKGDPDSEGGSGNRSVTGVENGSPDGTGSEGQVTGEGIEGGIACANGENCPAHVKVPITDPWNLSDGLFECPDYMAEHNCLNLGSGRRGDLVRIFQEFHSDPLKRETRCRALLESTVSSGGGMLTIPTEQQVQARAILDRPVDPTGQAACHYYFETIHGVQIPDASKETITQALASGTGPVRQLVLNVADVFQKQVERDIGVFAVQQQVKNLASLELQKNPGLLASESSFKGAYRDALGAASCLPASAKADLERQLGAIYAQTKSEAESQEPASAGATARGPASAFAGLKNNLVSGLRKAARQARDLEKAEYVMGMMRARLNCDRNAAQIADFWAGSGEDWRYHDRKSDVSDSTRQARERWFTGAFKDLTGVDVTRFYRNGQVNCFGLAEMQRIAHTKQHQVLSENPLLIDEAPLTEVDLSADRSLSPTTRLVRENQETYRRNYVVSVSCAGTESREGVPNVYGAPDAAAGFENSRWGGDCLRRKKLADRLLLGEGEGAVDEALARTKRRGVDRLREICGSNNGLQKEGSRAAHVDGIAMQYLTCSDVGQVSSECRERQSAAWLMCRSRGEHVQEQEVEELKQFYWNMALTVVGTASMMLPGTAIVARLASLGLTTAGVVHSYHQRESAIQNYRIAHVDLDNRNITYDDFRGKWEAMNDATKGYYFWTAVDVLFAGLDAHAIASAVKAGRAGRGAEFLNDLFESGDAQRAFERANAPGRHPTAADVPPEGLNRGLYNRFSRMEADHPGITDDFAASVRTDLGRQYGNGVHNLSNHEHVLEMDRVHRKISRLEAEGRIDPDLAREARESLSDGLKGCAL